MLLAFPNIIASPKIEAFFACPVFCVTYSTTYKIPYLSRFDGKIDGMEQMLFLKNIEN